MTYRALLCLCVFGAACQLGGCSNGSSGTRDDANPDGASSTGGIPNGAGGTKSNSSGTGGLHAVAASGGASTASQGGASGAANGSGTGGSSLTDSGAPANDGPLVTYGSPYTGGQFNLGPVDWAETQWHNACAPAAPDNYSPALQSAEGELLAGLWNGIPNVAGYCDACIHVQTAKGKSATLRVVTYGDTSTNSIDVSPAAYQILNSGEYPRSMTWQFAKCPDTGKIVYVFQTASSQWWTSLWVRNARVPLTKVEVESANHASYFALSRQSDGTLLDSGGFGKGPFSIRLTGVDGQQIVDQFAWPSPDIAGQTLTGAGNFK
jgi:expansin